MLKVYLVFLCLSLVLASKVHGQESKRLMEYLDRGLVAINSNNGKVFLSWRLLGTEPDDLGFNVYRQAGNAEAVKLNKNPITSSTNFTDNPLEANPHAQYFVRATIDGQEQEKSKSILAWDQNYLNIPLKTPEGYSPNDVSVGDLNGDGQYELVVHMTGRGRDNSQDGFTDEPIFHAYTM